MGGWALVMAAKSLHILLQNRIHFEQNHLNRCNTSIPSLADSLQPCSSITSFSNAGNHCTLSKDLQNMCPWVRLSRSLPGSQHYLHIISYGFHDLSACQHGYGAGGKGSPYAKSTDFQIGFLNSNYYLSTRFWECISWIEHTR